MKSVVITFLGIIHCIIAHGQYKFENFNNGLPDKWTTTSKVPLALNSEHFKDGNQSLKWEASDNDAIVISELAIPETETAGPLASEIFVYSKEPAFDTLVFQFFDLEGKLKREGRMLLNYKGWREYHRSFEYDYNGGEDQTPFKLNKCRILYKSAKERASNSIYFDAVRFTGNKDLRRQAAPHTQLDQHHFKQIGLAGGNPLGSWLNQPSVKLTKVSPDEAKDIEKLRGIYLKPLEPVNKRQLEEAMDYIRYSAITRNKDKSIKGRGIVAIANPDTLVKFSSYCSVLARSFLLNKNKESQEALIIFTEYLLDQGLAEGGRNVLPTNSYENARKFPSGFLEALAVYPAEMRAKVFAMLKWSHEYNRIYNDNFEPGINTDFIHLKAGTLVKLALLNPSEEEVLRDLKYIQRFLEQCVAISPGGNDGIKPDGIGFHHHSAHISYMVAFATWIEHAWSLKGTSFRISKNAYESMRLAIKSLLLETSKGLIIPHSLSGRKPFTSGVPVKPASVVKLIEIGDDLNLKDDEMKAFYNYVYAENRYPVRKADLDGFYQFNYAQFGVLRKDNWIAAMRGFTDRMFGAEIYDKQNRYGRYQSYGSVEILYNGNSNETGYIPYGKGWDWNAIPGTTTVHLPWNRLKAVGLTATEFQDRSFAGAMSLGKNGVFGFDFVQKSKSRYQNAGLTFRKSVFAFDRILVCLGTNINATTDVGYVATNLFQNVFKQDNLPIYVDNKKITHDGYSNSISVSDGSAWLINSVNTGYFIPKGNNNIELMKGEQEAPDYTANGMKMNVAWSSKAWINHGQHPKDIKYHFTIVPQTTLREMKDMVSKVEAGAIYNVLEQTKYAHIVKFLPENLTSYVFFEARENIDKGYVKSISNPCLLGIRENGETIVVTITSPDLNAVNDPDTYWKSVKQKVTLKLNGNWQVLENKCDAAIVNDKHILTATFDLIDGFSKEFILRKVNK